MREEEYYIKHQKKKKYYFSGFSLLKKDPIYGFSISKEREL